VPVGSRFDERGDLDDLGEGVAGAVVRVGDILPVQVHAEFGQVGRAARSLSEVRTAWSMASTVSAQAIRSAGAWRPRCAVRS